MGKFMLSKIFLHMIGALLIFGCTPRLSPNEPQTSPNQPNPSNDVQQDVHAGREDPQPLTPPSTNISPATEEKTLDSQLLLPPWLAPNWIHLVESGLTNTKLEPRGWQREETIKEIRTKLKLNYKRYQNERCDPPGSDLTDLSTELLSLSIDSIDFYLTGLVWLHLAYKETNCPDIRRSGWFATLAKQAFLIALKRPLTKDTEMQADIYKSLAEASCVAEDLETAWKALEELAKLGALEPVWVSSHISFSYIRQQDDWIVRLSQLFPKAKPKKPLIGAFSISPVNQDYQDDDEIWGFCENGQVKIIPRYGGDWQIVYYGQVRAQKEQTVIDLTLKCGMNDSGFGDCCNIKENRTINSQILRLQTIWLSTLDKPEHSLYPCDPPENQTLHENCEDIR